MTEELKHTYPKGSSPVEPKAAPAIQSLQQLSETVDETARLVHRQRESGDLLSATASCIRLEQLLENLVVRLPEQQEELWASFAAVLRPLTANVFEFLGSTIDAQDRAGESSADSAELCWRITHLLDAQLRHPITVAPWVQELHSRLLIRGAQVWSRLESSNPEARERSAWMFARLAARLDPCPAWVQFYCRQHGVTPEPDPETLTLPLTKTRSKAVVDGTILPSTEAYRPPQQRAEVKCTWQSENITADVIDWIECYGETSRIADLGLTYLPEGPLVSRDPNRLELNLAPLFESHDWWPVLQETMGAFLDPLKLAVQAGTLTRLGVRDITRGLHGSLAHLWRVGEQLPLATFFRLNRASAEWNRLTGPGHLGARLLSDDRSALRLGDQPLMVQLEATELAALQSVLYQSDALLPAMECIRREIHNKEYGESQDADWWWRPDHPEENLRRLHRESGFYATAGQEMQCLRAWADGSFRCLSKALLWSPDPIASNFFLPVAQALFAETGVTPELQLRPDLREIYRLMASQEVLYVGPYGPLVLDQHRSGRAFRLFLDQVIEPYGLQVVNQPQSCYPDQPSEGFMGSLDALINHMEQEYERKPFQVLLADCGAYRLPLLEALNRRLGVMGIAVGLPLAVVFGVDAPGAPRWAAERRRTENWRPVPMTRVPATKS